MGPGYIRELGNILEIPNYRFCPRAGARDSQKSGPRESESGPPGPRKAWVSLGLADEMVPAPAGGGGTTSAPIRVSR